MKGAWHTCEISTTLEIISGRWKSVIIFYLLSGPKRFSEIKRYLPGVTPRMLTLQLRELERDQVLSRYVHAQVPPRVDYELTAFGRSLEPVLISMRDWGIHYRDQVLNVRSSIPAGDRDLRCQV
jgi:DNA-binding HxlR family transcriptional regulator